VASPDRTEQQQLIRRSVAISIISAAMVAVLYLVFVRTQWGQEIDDLAFEGRAAVSAQATQRLDNMLRVISVSSLFVLGGAIVLIALAQRRLRLVFVVGASMSGAVVTTEVLKLHVLTRPVFADVQGIANNSYPSGHATIGMALSLGLVMVSTTRWRKVAAGFAALLATAFGTAVLATGWHRPSDTLGAYAVVLAWFAAGHAVLVWSDVAHPYRYGMATDRDRPPSRGLLIGAGLALMAWVSFSLFRSLDEGGLRAVDYAGWYVLACVLIDLVGIGVVLLLTVLTGERARLRRDTWDDPTPEPEPATP
jgi:membrane-associated phospholipid phosphatase